MNVQLIPLKLEPLRLDKRNGELQKSMGKQQNLHCTVCRIHVTQRVAHGGQGRAKEGTINTNTDNRSGGRRIIGHIRPPPRNGITFCIAVLCVDANFPSIYLAQTRRARPYKPSAAWKYEKRENVRCSVYKKLNNSWIVVIALCSVVLLTDAERVVVLKDFFNQFYRFFFLYSGQRASHPL